ASHRPNLEVLDDRNVPAFFAPGDYVVVGDYHDMKVGDFNNDGQPDLVTGNGFSVSVLLGNSDGTFQPARTSTTGAGSLAVGDFNEDGKLDLATDAFDDVLSILLGQGDGTFAPHTDFSLGFDAVCSFATGDLNGD